MNKANPKRHPSPRPSTLADRYASVRQASLGLAAPLSPEDCQVQSMPDASPTKWHLAHVTWFFETFILERFEPDFRAFDPSFRVLFNSYYKGIGEQYSRPHRGLITRPTLAEVKRFRADVDERMLALLAARPGDAEIEALVTLGLQHEQQHQELLLTDIKHALSFNPAASGYARRWPISRVKPEPMRWFGLEGGLVELGHDPARDGDFCFDNETPRHRANAEPFEIASRPVSYDEYLAFIDDAGYARPELWLSMGWDWVQAGRRSAPLYWMRDGDRWLNHTLQGTVAIDPHTPVCHLSYFEADAFARWAGRAAADRARMGACGAGAARAADRQLRRSRRLPPDAADRADRRRAGADVRRRLGMDRLGLPALSALSSARGPGRRIQRQVHVQPVRAARRLVRHAAGPRTSQLPQLLPAGSAVAVQRLAPGPRRLTRTAGPRRARPSLRAR